MIINISDCSWSPDLDQLMSEVEIIEIINQINLKEDGKEKT